MNERFQIFEVSLEAPEEQESLGTKEKFWFRHEQREHPMLIGVIHPSMIILDNRNRLKLLNPLPKLLNYTPKLLVFG